MILDAIILENFGVYRGRQEAILTPEPGKPIILFRGMNGGGKTTLFDALQLALYGPKARLSNRGRRAYKEYLRESIHRGVDPGEGASVTLRFRRYIEGQARHYEVRRSWQEGVKGIEENMHVFCDGLPDPILTEHWPETMENYLPSSLAHLFFFDGEQIKELAEGRNAAQILVTAVHSLLGLDQVDRLKMDLKALERRCLTSSMKLEITNNLNIIHDELTHIDNELKSLSSKERNLNKDIERSENLISDTEAKYISMGGEFFDQANTLKSELEMHLFEKRELEAQLRDLIAGPLPFLLALDIIKEIKEQAQKENSIRMCREQILELEIRDNHMIEKLCEENYDSEMLMYIKKHLESDRIHRIQIASQDIILNSDTDLPSSISHLISEILPFLQSHANHHYNELLKVEERIGQAQEKIERRPPQEYIKNIQEKLHREKKELENLEKSVDQLRQKKEYIVKRRRKLDEKLYNYELELQEKTTIKNDRLRLLWHIRHVCNSLDKLRNRVVFSHTDTLGRLIHDSLQCLLHKKKLIQALKINPKTFEAILTDRNGTAYPTELLSAGESQILAIALLWGLARASGRIVPTVIDTPLGRLDAKHRLRIIERYFPYAGHQILLLSTDTEMDNHDIHKLDKYIKNQYILKYDDIESCTKICKRYTRHENKN